MVEFSRVFVACLLPWIQKLPIISVRVDVAVIKQAYLKIIQTKMHCREHNGHWCNYQLCLESNSYCGDPATLCIVDKCAAAIFPTINCGALLQTPLYLVSKKTYLSSGRQLAVSQLFLKGHSQLAQIRIKISFHS